jgi:type IV pilus assembly protein PilV
MNSMLKITRVRQRSKGGVLIEALVSILILSIGLLGMAGLQVNAQSFQKTSWIYHRVSELVTDISEKVRSNPTGANANLYTYSKTYAAAKADTFTLNNCGTLGTACTVTQLASDDIATWATKAQTNIPVGAVLLSGDSNAGFVATVIWQDKESTTNPAICGGTELGAEWRNCCPSAASVSTTPGVKCYRAAFKP